MTKNDERLNTLFEELVPASGKADSLAGELVRATSRIGYSFSTTATSWGSGTAKRPATPRGAS